MPGLYRVASREDENELTTAPRSASSPSGLAARVTSALDRRVTSGRLALRARTFRRSLDVRSGPKLVSIGSNYGFWVVPDTLGPSSVCYLAGVGEDITFDLGLIARFGCTVHAFDPVPASGEYVSVAASHEPRFVFHPIGLWFEDAHLSFHAPAVEGHVSHSATDLHGTGVAFEADVRSVRSLMEELGHDRVDLLKLSVEGSEYEIVRGTLDAGVEAPVICIEYAQPAPAGAAESTHDRLQSAGYGVVAARIRPRSWKLTYMHGSALGQ
jgi:FkbM family methyltransferase